MSRGWYLMHRGWMTSGDFKPEPFTEPMAFIWSIEQAAFEAHAQWFNGVRYPVGRGQFVTSLRAMAKAFRWGLKRTIAFTCRMEERGKWIRVEAQPGKHGPTLLTVCNYARFQTLAKAEETPSELEGEQGGEQLGDTPDNTTELILTSGKELKPQEEGLPARADPCPYAEMVAVWSQGAGLKGWKALNPALNAKRKRGMAAIFKAHGLQGWTDGIQRALDSPLLGGPDPPGWFHFDFATNPNNFLKLIEGNYDKQFGNNRSEQPSGWIGAMQTVGGLSGAAGPVPEAQPRLLQSDAAQGTGAGQA